MLTKRQKQVLDYINKYIQKNDYAPLLEEIKTHLKLSSVSTAHHHVETLKALKYLTKKENVPRAIDITSKEEIVQIPISGVITAGQPIEAIESNAETISVSKKEAPRPHLYYALRVRGSSMIDDGIFDGDIALIKNQKTANNGETVVAIVDDNKATLKKFYKEKNRIRLQPANQLMLPIYKKEVEIRGVVTKIIRDLEHKFEAVAPLFSKDDIFAKKKEIFLNHIKSNNGKHKYKRFVTAPIRYAGGKSLAIGYVVELLPNNIKRLISPFFGGGSIEIACSKFLELEVIGFDIFDILTNYWQVQINEPKKLYEMLSKYKPTGEQYKIIKEKLKEHWEKKTKLPKHELAAYYYFNHNLSYGPGFLGWPSSVYMDKKRYKKMIEKVRDFSPGKLKVECANFEEVFDNYPNDFFYCDPPYFLGEDSKMFIGIYPMRNFPVHHNGFNHEKLRDLLIKHKGGFALSYNNCKTIRKWYKNYQQFFPEWQYTMGQGETRIGKNRINSKINHIKESHEIMIYCPPKI